MTFELRALPNIWAQLFFQRWIPAQKPMGSWISIKYYEVWPLLSPEKPVCKTEATVRSRHGTMDWFKIGKWVCQGCILSSCLFNFYAEHIMQHPGLDDLQARISIAGEISITSDMQMKPPLWRKWGRTKESHEEGEGGEWKSWLKTQY